MNAARKWCVEHDLILGFGVLCAAAVVILQLLFPVIV